jgi:hypothetical protein
MGRYYSGDIEGKFWFGVQSSTAADRFGVAHEIPSYVNYYYDESNLPEVEAEIEHIKSLLGDKLQQLDNFFESNDGYRDEMLEEIGITKQDLREYADLKLGEKIKQCIIDRGVCSFDAEL